MSTEKTNAVQGAFQSLDNADAPNLTSLVSEMGDLDGTRAATIEGLTLSIEKIVFSDEKTVFTHKGVIVHITHVMENDGDTDDSEFIRGERWDYEDVVACVKRVSPDDPVAYCVWMVANNFETLATKILDLMDDQKYCSLCGQLNQEMKADICRKCAISELTKPCRSCKRLIGRGMLLNEDGEPEHAACKRRRLM